MKNNRNGSLPYGFKAEAERIAVGFRKEMKLKPYDPLSAFDLAKHLEIPIYKPVQCGLTSSQAHQLMKDGSGWWGLTMKNEDDQFVIIYNTYQSPSRQQSTLMHEISHIVCEHEFPEPKIVANSPLPMRTYDARLEEEANCLGSTLQITREGLLWALKREMSVEEMAEHFFASKAMVTFRINTTGVRQQISFLKKYLQKRKINPVK